MSSDWRELEAYLHEQIPLTRAMGVRVVSYEDGALVLEAPLALNRNHLGTVFGGSLNALATLAGYALLWLELPDRNGHVVIRDSSISFRAPVRKEPRAICRRPDEAVLAKFRHDLARAGKARMRLEVTIEEGGAVAVEFAGTFVAVR
jgi:thioesterase domain-containing protein